jgi:putative phage-type endonuclease
MNAPEAVQEVDRSSFIGGTDASVIMGVSPYQTPVELWLEKTGQRTRQEPDKYKRRILERGKLLEPIILQMAVDKLIEQGHQVEILRTNHRYYDPEHAFLSCEIDFELLIDGEEVNGDCKSVHGFARKQWGEEETDEMPLHYAAQFMHGMGITGRSRTIVAALIGLDDVAIYWIDRDDETINAMREKCVTFWNDCILGGNPPDIMKFSDIKAIYPKDNGKAVEATTDIAEKVLELHNLKHQVKAWEERIETLQLDVAEFISPHSVLTFNGKEIATWKAQDATRLDQKALDAAHPDIVKKFKVTTSTRVFRLKKGN